MLRTVLAVLAAAAVLAGAPALPADARPKQAKRSAPPPSSLDNRVTGEPRSCGQDGLRYDSSGAPRGPYCH